MDRLFDSTAPIEDDMAKDVDFFVRDLVSHKLLGSMMMMIAFIITLGEVM